MPTLLWIALGVVVWIALAAVVGLGFGRWCRLVDEAFARQEGEGCNPIRR